MPVKEYFRTKSPGLVLGIFLPALGPLFNQCVQGLLCTRACGRCWNQRLKSKFDKRPAFLRLTSVWQTGPKQASRGPSLRVGEWGVQERNLREGEGSQEDELS